MSKEFTKSYAINRIAELNEQIVEMTTEQSETMRYLNKLKDNNKQLKQKLEEKDKEIERLKVFEKAYYFNQTQVSQESMDLLLQNAYQVHNETQLAIQELEKVKKRLLEESKRYPIVYDITDDLVGGAIDKDKTFEIIDNQIKVLKGE